MRLALLVRLREDRTRECFGLRAVLGAVQDAGRERLRDRAGLFGGATLSEGASGQGLGGSRGVGVVECPSGVGTYGLRGGLTVGRHGVCLG